MAGAGGRKSFTGDKLSTSRSVTDEEMSVGARQLTVLGEFKPFGLIVEALDGKPTEDVPDEYEYFLFDPKIVRERDESDDYDGSGGVVGGGRSDHELFIRGNRIIWTTGSRVYKRFTSSAPVVKACWCRLGETSEGFLCVLQFDTLTLYNVSGEVASIPLPDAVTSIWPSAFGLLIQQASGLKSPTSFFPSSSSLNSRYISRLKREHRQSPQRRFSLSDACDVLNKGDGCSLSSHLVLRDPFKEPQAIYIEERGKHTTMKEFDENTIWTSDQIPLVATYNEGKMQHSLWAVELVNSDLANPHLSDKVPAGVLPRHFSFRKIWQGKGVQTAAMKVFLATDDDATPVICFHLQDQRKLLLVGLQTLEINNEVIFDVTPDLSWSIPVIAAAPVIVTRPRAKVGALPFSDIIVLSPENTLLLYSGKQCLCRLFLPSSLNKSLGSYVIKSSKKAPMSDDLKITGLGDAVEGRINVTLNSGQVLRCALRRSPSSSLVNDCLAAMADGLSTEFYNCFLVRLWGGDDSGYLSKADSCVDSEWDSFTITLTQMCNKSCISEQLPLDSVPDSSWQFLVKSKFHKNYCNGNYCGGISRGVGLGQQEVITSRLPTAGTLKKQFYSKLLMESLESLHAVYEGLKLDNLRKRDLGLLVVLLCDVANFLGEMCYLDHYIRDFPRLSEKFGLQQNFFSSKVPPSVCRWLETCLQYGYSSASFSDLPPLICKNGSSVASSARKIVAFYSLLSGARQVGNKLSSGVYCKIADGSSTNCEELTVLAMVGERYGLQQLDSLPAGVSLPLRHALDNCRESPPSDWSPAAYVLLGREDLALSCSAHSRKHDELETQTNINLISMSTPYMLHLHPVAIPSTVSDTIGLDNTKLDYTDSVGGTMVDGMEHIFNSNTQLRYGRDMRLKEVRRLLCSARPVAIQMTVNPSASDQDIQQAQLWQLAQRTTALPFGRGAFTLATTSTLLTEALTVPKLVLAGRLPAQQNATVNLDPNIRNIQELKSWPEFHNAVAAGLRLAPLQGSMSRTWIIYNKPKEPNVFHAGLLFSLGLHGHLRVLSIADVYQYLLQEHESSTVGLMLGLAASYRGTMKPAISKALYFHIAGRHASSFPELELPTLIQSAALMSLGILFEGSAHPPTMHIFMAEMGRKSGGDNVLEREGYVVSAGFALGLVALGRGEDSLGYMDTLVNRLFQYVGGKDVHYERPAPSTLSVDDQSRGAGQVMEGAHINIDVTAPGAIIALALIFLKTESEAVVARLSIPQTHFDLQYVRPDFIMLRAIARNLIMWSRIHPSKEWIQSQIPEIIRRGVNGLQDETDENDAESFVQAYVNIVAGACISLGLRFAGSKNGEAQQLLYEYAVYFLNEIKQVSVTRGAHPKGLSQYVDRGTLEICLHLIVLSLSVVMAGSGHLQTLRFLRFLRARNSADGQANYGIQMAVSLAIGFLFLGGGTRTFSTSNSSIAALFVTLYPRLPTGPNDNRCHLQAFRHLYVLATEARWIQTIDVDTGLPVYAPLEITVRETEHYAETSFCEVSPCILPERSTLKAVRVCGPRYWTKLIEIIPDDKPWWISGDKTDPFNSGILYVKRKVGACSYVDDPVGCQSLLSRAMHKVFGLTSLKTSIASNSNGLIGPGSITVDHLISTFSSDPSMIAFAQLCCDPSWNIRSDADFQEFCLQILFECVSKDRPALLQVYMSLYTTIGSMVDLVTGSSVTPGDSLSIFSLKLALAYNEALLNGRLIMSKGGIVQSKFIGSIKKRVEELLRASHGLNENFLSYLSTGTWPDTDSEAGTRSILLSWYLQWFGVPAPSVVKNAVDKIKTKHTNLSLVPLLRLLLPRTHITAICEIDKICRSTS